jgi:hypothetical protein
VGLDKGLGSRETLLGWLSFVGLHSAFSLLVIPGIFFVFVWLSRLASSQKTVSLKTVFINLSYVLVPMGLAAWIAFSFGFLLPNGSYILHILSDPFARGWDLIGTADFPWTPVATEWLVPLQFVTLFFGYIVSADYGLKLAHQTYADKSAAMKGFIPIFGFLTLVTIAFVWLYEG